MINIEKDSNTPFRALHPASRIAPDAEVFTLAGYHTHIGPKLESPPASGKLQLGFTPLKADRQLPERVGRFSAAERDNILCLLASPDGRFGSLRINAPAQIYSCALGAGHQITYRVVPGHHLWLKLMDGALDINGHEVSRDQVATISEENQIKVCARLESEFLFVVLA